MIKISFVTCLIIFNAVPLIAENPDTTFRKIINNSISIREACSALDLNPAILASIIFVERTNNYSWEDKSMDNLLAYSGVNSSIGFCQVKIKTAYWIEHNYTDSTLLYYPGHKYHGLLNISSSKKELVNKLNNESKNIFYAAAYLRMMCSRWSSVYDISSRPDILGTLYSTGLFKSDGTERLPNTNPSSNDFGKEVLKVYPRFYNLFAD